MSLDEIYDELQIRTAACLDRAGISSVDQLSTLSLLSLHDKSAAGLLVLEEVFRIQQALSRKDTTGVVPLMPVPDMSASRFSEESQKLFHDAGWQVMTYSSLAMCTTEVGRIVVTVDEPSHLRLQALDPSSDLQIVVWLRPAADFRQMVKGLIAIAPRVGFQHLTPLHELEEIRSIQVETRGGLLPVHSS